MGRKRKNNVIRGITIESMAAEGKCVARHEDRVIFVEKVAPQDVVDIQITRRKKSFLEATPIALLEESPHRVTPFCDHFGLCGGCKWQHIDYQIQLKYKHKQVIDQLERIAKVELPEVSPILGTDKTRNYRNKLEFTFSNRKWLTNEEIQSGEDIDRDGLGFHLPGKFDKILDIQTCHLQEDISNQIRLEVKAFGKANNISFYDILDKKGLLRNLIIRLSSNGEIMVIVQFAENEPDAINLMMEHLKTTFPQITSLQYVINQKGNETFHDLDVITYAGRDHIIEEMEGLKFRIGPKSFYQTNSEQAYELYKVARDFAQFSGDEHVYDLYTGTGTIANFIAKNVKHVVGLEYVPEAIEDAKINALENQLPNTSFFAGDIKDLLDKDFIEENGRPDIIITDPPRAGMHEDVCRMILEVAPQRVVYVSCNPATQARDIAILDEKYKVVKVQPVDMFPQTYHVECVVLLELK